MIAWHVSFFEQTLTSESRIDMFSGFFDSAQRDF